ncbi:MAG: hypothetical protein P1U86_13345 [Verrucomicrobiales bacterium]|nr:hypothetical protein [Verrucomicrobiales bacterium]
MKTGLFTFSIVASQIAGLSLCVSTAQDLPAPDLPAPDAAALVGKDREVPPSEDIPFLASASTSTSAAPNADTPVAETAESPADLPDTPEAEAGAFSRLERTSMILSKIRDNERVVDPFGLPMDPGGLPSGSILADQYDEIVEEREVSETSLASALQELTLTGAYPTNQKIVLGARSFVKGDEFGMRFGELTLRIRFEGIEKKKVYFRDMDTKELAFLNFNPKPIEFEPMFKNSHLSTPDGITSMNNLFIVN